MKVKKFNGKEYVEKKLFDVYVKTNNSAFEECEKLRKENEGLGKSFNKISNDKQLLNNALLSNHDKQDTLREEIKFLKKIITKLLK